MTSYKDFLTDLWLDRLHREGDKAANIKCIGRYVPGAPIYVLPFEEDEAAWIERTQRENDERARHVIADQLIDQATAAWPSGATPVEQPQAPKQPPAGDPTPAWVLGSIAPCPRLEKSPIPNTFR